MLVDLTVKVDPNSDISKWAGNDLIKQGHVGTHLDTYLKTPIPLEYYESEGIVFDVRGLALVDMTDIDLSLIKENSFVIFRTGRMEEASYGTAKYMDNHPELSDALIEFLISKKIRFLGIDAPGIKQGEAHGKADKLLEDKGIYVIENLTNLDKLPMDVLVHTMWLDDENLTGLKVRVIAKF